MFIYGVHNALYNHSQRERDEQWIHAAHSIMRTSLIEKFQESTKTIATNGL